MAIGTIQGWKSKSSESSDGRLRGRGRRLRLQGGDRDHIPYA